MRKLKINPIILISLLTIFMLSPLIIGNYKRKKNINKFKIYDKSHKYVLKSFKKYNNNVDSSTVEKFIEVCDSFKIKKHLKTLTAQICYESGANHYDISDNVLKSSGNAIGVCQITPTTGYLYLKNIVSLDDELLFQLGGTEYCHILESDERNRRELVKEWLSYETNNLILYGYIMENNIKIYKGLKKSLLVYWKGPFFLKQKVEESVLLDTIKYIRTIDKIKHNF